MPRSTESGPKLFVTPLDFEHDFGVAGTVLPECGRFEGVAHRLVAPSTRPGARGQAVKPAVQRHRDDHYDADVDEEVVRADPDDR